jgi:hypothetical protein
MHDLTQTVLAETARRGGVIDPVAHFDLIVELDAVAHGLTRLPIDEQLIILDRPIVLSESVTVRRLSEAARAWLKEGPLTWWAKSSEMQSLAIAWAYCHARDRAAIESMPASSFIVMRRINAWRRSLDVPFDVIVAAIQSLDIPSPSISLLDPSDPSDTSDASTTEPPPTCGQIYAALMREHSCTLEYLLFDISDAQVEILIDALSTRNLAESVSSIDNGKVETESARRRRHNWTRAKKAFFAAVLPPNPAEVPANG